jgi:glutamate dehydrogenase (NAD(P)+)
MQAHERIREAIAANTAEVLQRAAVERTLPRAAAVAMAEARVRRATGWRRWR